MNALLESKTVYVMVYVGGVDYNAGLSNVMISAGDVRVTFNILINDDNILEATEEFNLTISSISSSRIFASSIQQATIFIIDNDSKY